MRASATLHFFYEVCKGGAENRFEPGVGRRGPSRRQRSTRAGRGTAFLLQFLLFQRRGEVRVDVLRLSATPEHADEHLGPGLVVGTDRQRLKRAHVATAHEQPMVGLGSPLPPDLPSQRVESAPPPVLVRLLQRGRARARVALTTAMGSSTKIVGSTIFRRLIRGRLWFSRTRFLIRRLRRALILPVDALIPLVDALILGVGDASLHVGAKRGRRQEPVGPNPPLLELGVQPLLHGLRAGHDSEQHWLVTAVRRELGEPRVGVDRPTDLDQAVGAGPDEQDKPPVHLLGLVIVGQAPPS